MARIFLRILQVITLVAFFYTLVQLVLLFDPVTTWRVDSLFRILGALKNVLSYFLYMGMGTGGYFSASIFQTASPVYQAAFGSAFEPTLFQFLNVLFHMTNDAGELVTFSSFNEMLGLGSMNASIFTLLTGQALTIASNAYFLLLVLCILMSVIYAFMFVGKCDIRHSIFSVVFMIAPIVIALFPGLILYILEMVNVPSMLGEEAWLEIMGLLRGNPAADPPWPGYFPEVVFVNEGILSGEMSPVDFFTHPGFLYALFSYLYLEASFQTSYVARVTQPSIERTRRLEGQIAVLGERSIAFELEQQQRMRERTVESTFTAKGEEEKKRLTLKSIFSGGGLNAIKEMVERRERERERERLEEVSSDTRRLDTYIKRLFEMDKQATASLTAIGSAPSQAGMIQSTLVNVGIRLGIIVGLTYFLVNPVLLFSVFRLPSIIGFSVGFNSPEAVVSSLVPIVLLFPLVSFIIRTYKQYKLTLAKNKKESESVFLRRLSELREVETEETVETGTGA